MNTVKKRAKEKLFYKVIVRDRTGKVISQQEAEAHSFLVQYNELLSGMMDFANRTIKDSGGTDRTVTTDLVSFSVAANIGEDARGIIVGTGNTAVAVGDYALEIAIAEGTGAGQMSYQAQTYDTDVTVADPDCTFELKRIIINNSGGTIVVAEIGIYCYLEGSYLGCIARDVLGASVSVPDGGSITVFYTWRITE